jgi:hypothetical protein
MPIASAYVYVRPRNMPRLELKLRSIVPLDPPDLVNRLYICALVAAEATVRAYNLNQVFKED